MDKKIELLEKMVNVKVDELGDIHYTALNFLFTDFVDLLKLDMDDYINFLKNMRHEGLIEIDLNGYKEITSSIIRATTIGMQFLNDNKSKNKIGF